MFNSFAVRPALWINLDPEDTSTSVSEESPEEYTPIPFDVFGQIGSFVTFGVYEQDSKLENGAEPIEWIVLDVQDGISLLVSRYALDWQPFNRTETAWDGSALRNWLNKSFLDAAFSKDEQSVINTTHVSAADTANPSYNTNAGNSTEDKIFLLSINEVENYLTSNEARQCIPTEYAKAQGCNVYGSSGACWWWLRSPGYLNLRTALINDYGSINYYGYRVFNSFAVRPALCINLS